MPHLNDLSVELKSTALANRRIALCVTGSIAATETVKLARELRRYGADVLAFLTPCAERFITPLSLEWATTHPVRKDFSGSAEHIADVDFVLVAPATLHTLNKVSLGLADNVVTTLIASALGKKLPLMFVPAMHDSLAQNPILKKNMGLLKEFKNVSFLEPKEKEGKLKLLDAEEIVPEISHLLNQKGRLSRKKILITAGPTKAHLDPVRFIGNISTGKLGLGLARELYLRGAEPTVVYGPGSESPHSYYRVLNVETPSQMLEQVLTLVKNETYDVAIFSAAVLDHVPNVYMDQKLSSLEELSVQWTSTPKIIREVDRVKALYKVGFKLEWKKGEEDLLKIGEMALETMRAQVVVVNDLSLVSPEKHEAWILDRKGQSIKVQTKNEIIQALIQKLEDDL